MYINRKINHKFIKKHRLLPIYIPILEDFGLNTSKSYVDTQKNLKHYFDFDASIEEISNYFDTNFYEYRLDKETQMKNLGIMYG
jgi:hypothetical protein